MPVTPTYPGVYIQEVPSGVRTITGVSTSVTAFIGYTPKGPVNKAVHIFNFGDYERKLGGLSRDSELGYAIQQFFLNGGTDAWVVRTASGATRAVVTLCRPSDGTRILTLTASSEGAWANYLKVDVDYATTNPDSTFNLSVTEYIPRGTDLVQGRKEVFQNLSMDSKASQYAPNVVNGGSQLVTSARHTAADGVLNALSAGWSLSTDLSAVAFPLSDATRFLSIIVDGDGPYEIPVFAAGSPPANLNALTAALEAAIQAINPSLDRFSGFSVDRASADGTLSATGNFLKFTSGTPATAAREQSSVQLLNASKNNIAKLLGLGLANRGRAGGGAADLRPAASGTLGNPVFSFATITAGDRLTMAVADGTTSLGSATNVSLGSTVSSLSDLATKLQAAIRAAVPANPAFSLASVRVAGNRLQVVAGTEKTDATITFTNGGGNLATKAGLTGAGVENNVQRYSPGVGIDREDQLDASAGNNGTPPNASELIGQLASKSGIYALEDVDIFNLLCIPLVADMDETSALSVISAAQAYCTARRAFYIVDPPRARNGVEQVKEWQTDKLTPDKNSAFYFPFLLLPDPLDGMRQNAFPPSGTLAGLYARIDSNRGIWKAPAGTEATLANVQGVAYSLTDAEIGTLNQVGVNCLRQMPVYGRVAWGARTLEGNDQQASEWKYIPVRRIALYIEESLYRGTQWVVFEPNDEPLWAQIRLNVGAFMNGLFRQGAFQGATPRDAYFVKCDKETTTQDDINRGVVNILVGFAPLKPAEFVIIQIQQIAGQIQA
ncbi:MAG: phage tail sheath subtilisin-like domain-containing protein [Anaerolineales bacterium]|nr:phage tail sheath subtilisin-like domain-containing protein [Anaerolineales bacterium]